ncbi:phosphatase PAP2 family protein [Devosia neptuniae]|uniref:phosphatase PAP2 family protein n=2 Tax=Devosia TaxID=46913 RepID=UPI0022AF44E1|nr:phosphatase PAP2 family protein [Devosia neptuniae]MCZ4346277.1 phosphatase PAP2 family protein [Devosia neptuniae]
MSKLTRRWPFGLSSRTWPDRAMAVILVLFVLVFVDAWASQSAQAWPDVWRAPFAFVTDFGLSDWVLIPSLLVFVVTFIALRLPQGRYRAAIHELSLLSGFVFVGVGLPGLFVNLLKRLIGRARPDHFLDLGAFHFQPIFNDWSFQSFPSGHTTTAIGTALVVGFMMPRLFRVILFIAVMTGLSRVVIGMHYPTDVVGGFVVGTLGAYAVRNGFARRRWLFVARSDGSVRFRGVPNLRRLFRGRLQRAAE